MRPVLILIDMQQDFLQTPGLVPAAGQIVDRAATLLDRCRQGAVPVIHVWTTVRRDEDRRMPHWKRNGTWRCVAGTPGHAAPEPLRPRADEQVVHKSGFSPFAAGAGIEAILAGLGADTLWLAGVHLHGCVRATALDAHQRGLAVRIAEDATGSDDPLHAAVTRRYLHERGMEFRPVLALMAGGATELAGGAEIADACAAARETHIEWRLRPMRERAALLSRVGELLAAEAPALARMMALELHKPVRYGVAEVARAVALAAGAARRARDPLEAPCGPRSVVRYRPVGVIAAITPWNNPVAIPLGKIAPALLYGDAVVWKPAPQAESVTQRLVALLAAARCPRGLVAVVEGGRDAAAALASNEHVDAVSVTGPLSAGLAMQELCARRHIPLQAELGGNNAAIVWHDADLNAAAARIAEAAFGFAGQRCTANRRVVVEHSCRDEFLARLRDAVAVLPCGDPLDPRTVVGPMISAERRAEGAGVVCRASLLFAGAERDDPAYHPPAVARGDDPASEIVQQETFGPVLVLQPASDWLEALRLCAGVRQGLAAALFSESRARIEQFLQETPAGILKINLATADADADAPFGGWKASGIGPPEHGPSDREFYTRTQAVYVAEPAP